MKLVSALPADFPATVFLVLHYPPDSASVLPEILSRSGPLKARHARDHMPIEPGQILIAPPDFHLLIEPGHVHVVHGPKENGFRPAIDPLFRSAALAYGRRVTGVILTGLLDDGTAGMLAVKRCGGVTVVQDPTDALFDGMPKSVIRYVDIDHVLPLSEIPGRLVELATAPIASEENGSMTKERDENSKLRTEHGIDLLDAAAIQQSATLGTPTPFSCPDCGGVLSELFDGPLLRFRCQVGHAFSPESVTAAQADALDHALWQAFAMLDQRVKLIQRLTEDATAHNDPMATRRFRAQVEEIELQKSLVRDVLDKCATLRPSEREPANTVTAGEDTARNKRRSGT